MQGHDDMVADAGQRLVDRIVDDLPQAVHQTLAVGGADVHARTLAHRIKPVQHGEVARAVIVFRHYSHSVNAVYL